jgi:CRP-like cAMP-binding protein
MDDEALSPRDYAAGEIIIRQGDPGHAAYLVVRGQVEVVAEGPAGARRLSRLGPEAIFGEMALIDGRPRSATVRAIVPTSCLIITRAVFDHVMERADPVLRALLLAAFRRLRTQNHRGG